MSATQRAWSVYVLRCADDSLYTGIALNVQERLAAHREGVRGAKYLRGRAPYRLVFEHSMGNRSAASVAEYRIKRYPKREKERLLRSPMTFRRLLDEWANEDRHYAAQASQSARVASSDGK